MNKTASGITFTATPASPLIIRVINIARKDSHAGISKKTTSLLSGEGREPCFTPVVKKTRKSSSAEIYIKDDLEKQKGTFPRGVQSRKRKGD